MEGFEKKIHHDREVQTKLNEVSESYMEERTGYLADENFSFYTAMVPVCGRDSVIEIPVLYRKEKTMMKSMISRLTVFLIGILLCFSLFGCNESDGQNEDSMFLGEWLGYNTDGDGDLMAQRLTLYGDGTAAYAYDAFGEMVYQYSGTWTQNGEGMLEFALQGGKDGESIPMQLTAACVVTEADRMVFTVISGDNILPDEVGGSYGYTFCRKDSQIPLIDGAWLGSNEDNDGTMHIMKLTLHADGTAEYFQSYYDSDIIAQYSGTWTRSEGMIALALTGATDEGDFIGEYIWNFRGGDLVLVHAGGDSFIDGADGGYYYFSPGDAAG